MKRKIVVAFACMLSLAYVSSTKLTEAANKLDAMPTEKVVIEAEPTPLVVRKEIERPVPIKDEEPEKEVIEERKALYSVPEYYEAYGGYMEDKLLIYLEDLCNERNVSYPLVLAMIERETGYRNVDSDGYYGYMQISSYWHSGRMEKLGCTDLTDPYDNVNVGTDYIAELLEMYEDVHKALMAYNMGGGAASGLWEQGITTSDYSRYIVARAEEISHEIYGE